MRCVSVCMCVLVGERVVCHGISVDLYSHLTLWNSFVQILQLHRPSGGESNGGDRQYMWYLFGIERLENSNVMRVNLIKMLNENKKKDNRKKLGTKQLTLDHNRHKTTVDRHCLMCRRWSNIYIQYTAIYIFSQKWSCLVWTEGMMGDPNDHNPNKTPNPPEPI